MSVSVDIGQVVAGKYRVERVLGAGGMGMVVEVTHLELLQRMAIKLMLPEVSMSPELAERFLREARAAAALKSQHVTKVFDVGRLEDGSLYMVMEHLTGSDLTDVVQSRGALPVSEAALYVVQACEAMAEAHRRGLVHRDIKPANLFLTRAADGSPCIKVLDFGVAKATAEVSKTGTGALLGTPLYMSPEQVRGDRDIDARTDIWALGAVLYELVTGAVPFTGDSVWKIFKEVMDIEPAPPSSRKAELPEGFDAVVLRCLEKDRDKRTATMAELARSLAPYLPEGARGLVERVERVQTATEEAGSSRLSEEPGSSVEHVSIQVTATGAPASAALALQKTELSHPGVRVTAGGVTQTNPPLPSRKPDRFIAAVVALLFVIAAIAGTMRWSRSSGPEVAASPTSGPAPSLEPTKATAAEPREPSKPGAPSPPAPPRPPQAPAAEPAPATPPKPIVPALVEPVVEPVLGSIVEPATSVKPASGPAAKPAATAGSKAPPPSDRHNVRIP